MIKNSKMKDTFSSYKAALKQQYEENKSGVFANFLVQPTPARLRDLGILLFKENRSQNDKKVFQSFLGFEFEINSIQKIKKETNKFKPLATFLKNETELSDFNAADFLAILVDFQQRPYSKFLQQGVTEVKRFDNEPTVEEENLIKAQEYEYNPLPLKNSKRKAIFIFAGIIGLLTISYIVRKEFFPAKECMQWNNDHYEEVVCAGNKIGFYDINPIFDKNDDLLDFKKISVCDTTTFFKYNQPMVWYIKQNGKCEYFNAPGLHPISGKPLRPISKYIIAKYIKQH
jgi:hypothetical protein